MTISNVQHTAQRTGGAGTVTAGGTWASSTAGTTLAAVLTSATGGTAFTGPAGWTQQVVIVNGSAIRTEIWTYEQNPGSIAGSSISFTSGTSNVTGEFSEWSSSLSGAFVALAQTATASGAGVASFPVSASAANLAGDLGLVIFGEAFSATQTSQSWTTPAGWTAYSSFSNAVLNDQVCAHLALPAGTVSVTGTYSTATNATGWAAALAIFTEVPYVADAGVGSDVLGAANTAALADTGEGADSFVLGTVPPAGIPDAGAGTDALSPVFPSSVSDAGEGADSFITQPPVILVQQTTTMGTNNGSFTKSLPNPSTPGTTLIATVVSSAGNTPFTGPPGWQRVVSASAGSLCRTEVWQYQDNPGGITSAMFASGASYVNGSLSEWAATQPGMEVTVDTTGTATVIPSSSGAPGLAGDNCEPADYGGTSQAAAIVNWQLVTGRTLAVRRRYFPGAPPATITPDLLADAQAGRAVALSFRPSLSLSSGDRSVIGSFLSSCKTAGLVAQVALWHEPVQQIGSSATYAAMAAYYGPTVRTYYPLDYSGQASQGAGTAANHAAYYSAAKTAGATFDAASVDHYASDMINGGITIDAYAAVTDADSLPFGIWEMGADEADLAAADITRYYNYLSGYFTARVAAGKAAGYVCHYTASPPGQLSTPPYTAVDSQIPLYQALYDAVSTPAPGTMPASAAVTETAASASGDAVLAAYGISFAGTQAGNTWTPPAGWSVLATASNASRPLTIGSFYELGAMPGAVSATGTYSTSSGITSWAACIISLTATPTTTTTVAVTLSDTGSAQDAGSISETPVLGLPDAGVAGDDVLAVTVTGQPVMLAEPGAGTDALLFVVPAPLAAVTAAPAAFPAFTRSQMPVMHVQNILTGQWASRDVQGITVPSITWMLNGADTFNCTLSPPRRDLIALGGGPLIQEWQSAIYLEEEGEIKYGGLVTAGAFSGPAWQITATGFAGYPNGMPYEGPHFSATDIDALDVVRYLWGWLQSQPDANLGMELDNTLAGVNLGAFSSSGALTETTTSNDHGDVWLHVVTSTGFASKQRVQIGGETRTIKLVREKLITLTTPLDSYHPAGSVVAQVVPPNPFVLDWFNSTDIGQEITQIQGEAPFDYREEHVWADEGKTGVRHFLRFGVPRIGGRKPLLRFAEGENVIQAVQITRDGTAYANAVVGLGAGQGSTMLRRTAAVRDGRLRRVYVYTDQTVRDLGRLGRIAAKQLAARIQLDSVTQVVIKNHENAEFGSFGPGDDILVTLAGTAWRSGQFWSRIISMTQDPTTSLMTLTTARSDSFVYAPSSGQAGTL